MVNRVKNILKVEIDGRGVKGLLGDMGNCNTACGTLAYGFV